MYCLYYLYSLLVDLIVGHFWQLFISETFYNFVFTLKITIRYNVLFVAAHVLLLSIFLSDEPSVHSSRWCLSHHASLRNLYSPKPGSKITTEISKKACCAIDQAPRFVTGAWSWAPKLSKIDKSSVLPAITKWLLDILDFLGYYALKHRTSNAYGFVYIHLGLDFQNLNED